MSRVSERLFSFCERYCEHCCGHEQRKCEKNRKLQQLLGHKSMLSTTLYVHLVNFESDDFHSATAKTVEEAQKLVESGFEYICDFESIKLFRKRK